MRRVCAVGAGGRGAIEARIAGWYCWGSDCGREEVSTNPGAGVPLPPFSAWKAHETAFLIPDRRWPASPRTSHRATAIVLIIASPPVPDSMASNGARFPSPALPLCTANLHARVGRPSTPACDYRPHRAASVHPRGNSSFPLASYFNCLFN